VVLVGQPPLLETLKTRPMYAQRAGDARHVDAAAAADVAAYIKHRLTSLAARRPFAPEAAASWPSCRAPAAARQRPSDRVQEGIKGASIITSEMVKQAARSLVSALRSARPTKRGRRRARKTQRILHTFWRHRARSVAGGRGAALARARSATATTRAACRMARAFRAPAPPRDLRLATTTGARRRRDCGGDRVGRGSALPDDRHELD
jgi:hypothetical protein